MQLNEAKSGLVFDIFKEISSVPRPSKDEGKILSWLKNFADEHGFEYKSDSVGNLLINVPASVGYESKEPICLQAHVDMVCEKTPDSDHDFNEDSLELREENGWLMATNTTLGADNGIGMALALAAAVGEDCEHPEMELLLTVDEETGLTGAYGLDSGFIKSTKLLNLDSEDESFIIGCAGGQECGLKLPINWVGAKNDYKQYILKISGLTGGHSGSDIHENRANANKLIAEVLVELKVDEVDFGLAKIQGGSSRNAISRDAYAIILISSADIKKAEKVINKANEEYKLKYEHTDPSLKTELSQAQQGSFERCFDDMTFTKLIDVLKAIPHGAMHFSSVFPGVVETSNNLATIKLGEDDKYVELLSLSRSCVMSKLDETTDLLASIGEVTGCEVEVMGRYPAWQPNVNSSLLGRAKEVYKEQHGEYPVVEIIHAGLECGVIGEKFADMDMISFGPVIEFAHSPKERLNIESVGKNWEFLKMLLKEID